jgi:hypothetical protein
VKLVFALADHHEPSSARLDMATNLIVRDSTAVPPTRGNESFVYRLET